jgi:hypothetical protein
MEVLERLAIRKAGAGRPQTFHSAVDIAYLRRISCLQRIFLPFDLLKVVMLSNYFRVNINQPFFPYD